MDVKTQLGWHWLKNIRQEDNKMSTDILVSFDSTGSMSPVIHVVRQRVKETISKLFSTIPDLRIGLIAHGDYCDEPRAYFQQDFTTDENALIRFVNTVPNTHGGDSDEFYEYVFHRASQLNWRADRRLFIFIADALPHRVGYSYNYKTYSLDWRTEVKNLSSMGVSIYSVEALGNRNAREFYQPIADMTNGRMVELNQFSDVVETITAISYHNLGTKLEEYKEELVSGYKMNRNLAHVFEKLGISKHSTFIPSEVSGLIPVEPYRFQVLLVDENCDIKGFVIKSGATFKKGKGFYQFTKREMVQENKEVVLVNKRTGDMFTGDAAREMIGLPRGQRGNVSPRMLESYDVYIQSTSANRKLIGGTKFLYETTYE